MSYEIVSQVENLFSDREQWESFLDIYSQKNLIRDTWWRKFQSEINKSVKSVQNWGYSANNHLDYRWYINEFGMNSFCLIAANYYDKFSGEKFSLGFWAPQYKYNIKTLSELLQKEEYGEPIKAKFDKLNFTGNEATEWKYVENFVFDEVKENKNLDIDRLAWYANYETSKLVSQVVAKVDKFREDAEITRILTELNNDTMIK
jgi:hypothetical protein